MTPFAKTLKYSAIAAIVAVTAPIAVHASGYTFTDTSSGIENLSHGTAATWGLSGASLTSLETSIKNGQVATGATLTLTGIYDWTVETDDVLYVNLLNKVASGDSVVTYNSNPSTNDTSYGQDPFVIGSTGGTTPAEYTTTATGLKVTGGSSLAFQGITAGSNQTSSLLVASGLPVGDPGTYTDPKGGGPGVTVTITLSAANLALLNTYLVADDTGSADLGLGFGPDCHFFDGGASLSITTGAKPVPDTAATAAMVGAALLGLFGFARLSKRSTAA
jgi:hypothetical protein